MKQSHSKPEAHRIADDDDGLEEDWLDEDWEGSEFEDGVEWGLPLGAENIVTGEPLVTVDYFDFAPAHKTAIADRLLALEGAAGGDRAPRPLRLRARRGAGRFGRHGALPGADQREPGRGLSERGVKGG